MKYKSILAVAIVAAFIIAAVPMLSDGSDAATMTDGSAGAGYEVKDMSGDDLAKIFPAEWQLDNAKGILDVIIVDDVANYDFSTPVVTEYNASEYYGEKIEGHDHTEVQSHSTTYKIAFTATCNSAVKHTLLENNEKNKDLLKEIGIENQSQEGAVFTISATVTNIGTSQYKNTYEGNSIGLVKTATWAKQASRWVTDSDVTYKFNDGTGDKTISFSSSNGTESSAIVKTTYDFLGVAIANVTDDTKELIDRDISEYGNHIWDTVKFNDNELGVDVIYFDPATDPAYVPVGYDYADITVTDLSVGEYHLYGTTGTCIFGPYSTIDPSLKDADALKTFITAHGGSYSDGDYDPAKSAADAAYKDVSVMDEFKLALIVLAVVIGAFALLFLILIIVVIILIVKRKKR